MKMLIMVLMGLLVLSGCNGPSKSQAGPSGATVAALSNTPPTQACAISNVKTNGAHFAAVGNNRYKCIERGGAGLTIYLAFYDNGHALYNDARVIPSADVELVPVTTAYPDCFTNGIKQADGQDQVDLQGMTLDSGNYLNFVRIEIIGGEYGDYDCALE